MMKTFFMKKVVVITEIVRFQRTVPPSFQSQTIRFACNSCHSVYKAVITYYTIK
jgi:hypothetical protein